MTEYLVVIHPAEEGGYWAEVPSLDGCFAQGETVEDVLHDARGAIESHLQALRDLRESVPAASQVLLASLRADRLGASSLPVTSH